jgi:hypothetical protein
MEAHETDRSRVSVVGRFQCPVSFQATSKHWPGDSSLPGVRIFGTMRNEFCGLVLSVWFEKGGDDSLSPSWLIWSQTEGAAVFARVALNDKHQVWI